LVKICFPDYTYINLEKPDIREFARFDPNGFFNKYSGRIILDEIQYVPELISYIQVLVDENDKPGQFILTGSQHFLISERISQSLAGRTAIFTLLPFSIEELKKEDIKQQGYSTFLFKGFYPRLYDKNLYPDEWLPYYIQTYLERDVRQVINVRDLSTFERFLKLCAGQVGQLLNMNNMANDLGIDSKTVRSWISILEQSFIVYLLPPFYKNYRKRLIKSPKLYFYDTGLVCCLLSIRESEIIDTHYMKGSLFENFVINELLKYQLNHRLNINYYFWRDSTGNEIDCIYQQGASTNIIEIKSGQTFKTDFLKGLRYYKKLATDEDIRSFIVYGGTEDQSFQDSEIVNWMNLDKIFRN